MNCKYCKADCAMRGDDNPKECRGFIPMTNADHIRSMTDGELAEWIVFTNTMCECCADLHRCDGPRSHIRCGKGIRNWLKQPCKEDT